MKMNIQQKRIVIALLEANLSQAAIARELDVARQYVSDVVAGRRRSRKVEDLIAARTMHHVAELFPYRQDNGNEVNVNEESRGKSSCPSTSL